MPKRTVLRKGMLAVTTKDRGMTCSGRMLPAGSTVRLMTDKPDMDGDIRIAESKESYRHNDGRWFWLNELRLPTAQEKKAWS